LDRYPPTWPERRRPHVLWSSFLPEPTEAAISASLNGVAADEARSDGSGNRSTGRNRSKSDEQNQITLSSQRAGGEQRAPLLVKVRHGADDGKSPMPISCVDEGNIR
jgi:hypothetical protein